MKQSLIYNVIFIFIISFIFVLCLSFVNNQTQDRILLNQQLELQEAVLSALNIPFESDEDILSAYEEIITTPTKTGDLYRYQRDGEEIFAHVFSGSGLWGTIRGVLAIEKDGDRIVNMQIISHNETPGLGGRITEKWFLDQLKGEKIINDTINVRPSTTETVGDEDKQNSTIDAITGATRTSTVIESILAQEIQLLRNLIRENT